MDPLRVTFRRAGDNSAHTFDLPHNSAARLHPEVGAIAWYRNEVVIMNGDVSAPPRVLGGRLTVSRPGGVLIDKPVALDPGASDVVALTAPYFFRVRPDSEAYAEYLVGGGPGLASVPREDLDAYGVPGDARKTTATGSGRLFADRMPAAMAILVDHYTTGDTPDPSRIDAIMERVRYQGRRGYVYYRWAEGWPAPLCASEGFCRYRGYNSNDGGFRALNGAAIPEAHGGEYAFPPQDDQHATLHAEAFASAFLGSWYATFLMGHQIETFREMLRWDGWPQVRSYGWTLMATAHALAAAGATSDHVRDAGAAFVSEALDELASRRMAGAVVANAPDFGSQGSDGGHMDPDGIRPILLAIKPSATEDEVQHFARSMSAWMAGPLGCALHMLLAFHPGKGVRQVFLAEADVLSQFYAAACGPLIDLSHGLVVRTQPDTGMWDDVGVAAGLGQGGTMKTAKGVYARFALPGMVAVADVIADHADTLADGDGEERAIVTILRERATLIRDRALHIAGILDGLRHWNTSDYRKWMLESGWRIGALRGWADPR